ERRGRGAWLPALLFACLIQAGVPMGALAEVKSVSVHPEHPTTCDSVALLVSGEVPNSCYRILGAYWNRPRPLPTAGPIPSYELHAFVRVQEPNPVSGVVCPIVTQPYMRDLQVGRLPFGLYVVHVTEYVAPFSEDSTAAPTDTSSISTSFQVGVNGCPPGAGCYMLGFERATSPSPGDSVSAACDASAIPGGTGCFNVTLSNEVPVAGIEIEIMVNNEYYDAYGVPPGLFTPVSVQGVGRAASFSVRWTHPEASRVHILLYPTISTLEYPPPPRTLPAGQGAILRVCYRASGQAGMGTYPMRFITSTVSDPNGVALPACPTFAEIVGSFCVASGACDLDGDGVFNIQDLVLLVGCVLRQSQPPVQCPDHGCIDDGLLDIRDIVCCIRRILDGGFGPSAGSGTPWSPGMTRIGFVDEPKWTDPSTGHFSVEVEPGIGFGGIQFAIDRSGAARLRDLTMSAGQGDYSMEWSDAGGSAHVMIYRNYPSRAPAGAPAGLVQPIRVEGVFEPIPGASGPTTFTLNAIATATAAGASAQTSVASQTATILWNLVTAPAVFAPAPNPFTSETAIAYMLPANTWVQIRIYDVKGRLVRTLTEGNATAGPHATSWDGRDDTGRTLGSGIYFFKVIAGTTVTTDRVLKLR
ncbi:MAG: FlgD immunoglobulin-like domain containing protein, partial [Candidatus Eiseniibacteriota bacterium]